MGVCDRLFTIRMPALTFVLGHIVRTSRGQQGVAGMDEQLYLLGTDIDIESMLATLLRRDMSLSRRLFSWLLKSEFNLALLPSSPSIVMIDQASRYILTYSADLVVQAVAMVMEQAFPLPGSQKLLDMKPFRIITEAVFVTMDPLLTQEQMSLVTARTGTVQKIAETLRTCLLSPPYFSLRCVSLLHSLLTNLQQVEIVVDSSLSISPIAFCSECKSFNLLKTP